MKNHAVTQSQAKKIGIPAGTVIRVEMYTEDEIQVRIEFVPEIRNIAKWCYLPNGIRRENLNLAE